MDLSAKAFLKLFDLLNKKLYDSLTDKQKGDLSRGENDYKLWLDDRIGKNDINLFDEIFKGTGLARDHFYKKAGAIRKSKAQIVTIRDNFSIAAFYGVGMKIPENTRPSGIEHEYQIAQFLYDEFLKEYPETNDEKSFVDTLLQIPDLKESEISQEDISLLVNQKKFTEIVNEYFSCLTDKNYKKAFDFWLPESKEEFWNTDLSEFIRQFHYLKSIKLTGCFTNFLQKENVMFFAFGYNQIIHSFFSVELENILKFNSPRIENIKQFTKDVQSLNNRAGRNHIQLSVEPIASFFDYTIIEKIHYLMINHPEILKAILPDQTDVSIYRMAYIQFQEGPNGRLYFKSFKTTATTRIEFNTQILDANRKTKKSYY